MNFLADENVHSFIVRWLRNNGHDVLWATESLCGSSDHALLARAAAESRLMLTADMDFGELVFHHRLVTHGVVLIRMDDVPIQERIARIAAVIPTLVSTDGRFIVITKTKLRIRPLPKAEQQP